MLGKNKIFPLLFIFLMNSAAYLQNDSSNQKLESLIKNAPAKERQMTSDKSPDGYIKLCQRMASIYNDYKNIIALSDDLKNSRPEEYEALLRRYRVNMGAIRSKKRRYEEMLITSCNYLPG